ncbi:MAG TPA: protein translocase subunit SecF [Ilumatobacteraceae bacterium]|nr:protein translocase subunit SecF [Ilumatobacteraceae bacterium]
MSTLETGEDAGADGVEMPRARRNVWGRLYHGETRMDFMGRRWLGAGISLALIVVTVISLFAQGLNLGLDFEGGVQWELPSANLTEDQVLGVLNEHGIGTSDAKIQYVTASGVDRIRIQVGEQEPAVRQAVFEDFGALVGNVDDVSSSSVSASWGEEITNKAVRALVVFVILVSIFIAWRFEWRMAVGAIAAMFHDVLISVGVYSVLQLEVTPSTVIAFLTILGFSLYDTIVVFDKIDENTERYGASKVPYDDVINVSMNQVFMRSLNTNITAVLPVVSMLVIGSGIMGAIALRDFSLALFVGLITGSYSSIFIAAPVLAQLKKGTPKWKAANSIPRATGDELERLVLGGLPASRHEKKAKAGTGAAGAATTVSTAAPVTVEQLLTHAPRPRKKTRH